MVGYDVHLVFDRGFACPAIIKFLNEIKVKFTIRIKKNKHVVPVHGTKKIAVQYLSKRSTKVKAYGCVVRIVRSKHSSAHAEAWYLVTNDFDTSTHHTIIRYYHRFEIEEWFKDAKRLAHLEQLRTVNDQTFTIVLWFVMLGAWIAWLVNTIRTAWHQSILNIHHKRSLLRLWFEQLLFERQTIVRATLKTRYG